MAETPRTALITGASSGIGEAFVEVFAEHGFNLVLVARREDRLRALEDRLRQRQQVAVHVIVADLSDRDAPAHICDELAAKGITIDALVNNAGYGIPGVYTASAWEKHEAMLHVMVISVAELTRRLLPAMIEREYGRIVNVASLAAFVPAPAGHTLYAATKAFVVRFSEALSHEVRRNGVNVTAVCPGFTLSEFHDVTGTREQVSRMPKWMWMDARTVASQGFDAVMAGTPIYINGRVNRAIAALVRYVPLSIVTTVGRQIGRAYRKT